MTTTPHSFIAHPTAKPDCDTLREVFENCMSLTRAEPGDVNYDLRCSATTSAPRTSRLASPSDHSP